MSTSHRWPVRCQNKAVVMEERLTVSDTLMFEVSHLRLSVAKSLLLTSTQRRMSGHRPTENSLTIQSVQKDYIHFFKKLTAGFSFS